MELGNGNWNFKKRVADRDFQRRQRYLHPSGFFFAAILLYDMETLISIPLNRILASGNTDNRYQVDMNCTWALVVTLVEDFFQSQKVFDRELTFCLKFCLHATSIVRTGRSSPRIKRKIKLEGKYITLTNYKRGL